MNFDQNTMGMAMGFAAAMSMMQQMNAMPAQGVTRQQLALPQPNPPGTPDTLQKRRKGKKGLKKTKVKDDEATDSEQSHEDASMYFTGHSIIEHCKLNPCYMCNDFDDHAARHHNVKPWPAELTARYDANRENWMVIKGPVQRAIFQIQDPSAKSFLAQRLSVTNTAPFQHLSDKSFVTALLNAASGLPPYPTLRELRQRVDQSMPVDRVIPVAPAVAHSSSSYGPQPPQQPQPTTDPTATPFQFADPAANPAVTTFSRRTTPMNLDSPNGKKRSASGAKRQTAPRGPPGPFTFTSSVTTAALTTAQPSAFGQDKPVAFTAQGTVLSPQQADLQWRIQVQDSITTLQHGQQAMQHTIGEMQVDSSVATYMMGMHLTKSMGWTDEQYREKLASERQRQIAIREEQKSKQRLPLSVTPLLQGPSTKPASGHVNPPDVVNVDAICNDVLPESKQEASNSDERSSQDLTMPDSDNDTATESEPRVCSHDNWLEGRKSLGSLRTVDMVAEMSQQLQNQGNAMVDLPTFSRRSDAIHFLGHICAVGFFAVIKADHSDEGTQCSQPRVEEPHRKDDVYEVHTVRSLGLAGQPRALLFKEYCPRVLELASKAPSAMLIPEGSTVWEIPEHMMFLRSADAQFKAETLVPPNKRQKSVQFEEPKP